MRLACCCALVAWTFALSPFALASETMKSDAEAGVVLVTGTSDSESYNVKGKATFTEEKNVYSTFGRYLRTTSNHVESALNWEFGARFEKELSDKVGLFIGQKAESDIFNGYLQRDSTDAGVAYTIYHDPKKTWLWELGYRYQKVLGTTGPNTDDSLGRIYSEYTRSLDHMLTFKYWVEYLPNLTSPRGYLANTEPSLSVMMSTVLSLKLAYLLQYQNAPPGNGKYTTTTTTLSLVAKF